VKILIVHNAYQQEGGEDCVAKAEARVLEARGDTVLWYERHNDELRSRRAMGALSAAIETVWASKAFHDLKVLIADKRPDVAHFHNTFPLVSPAAYYACAEAEVPVVQTLHNYRLLCPAATFMRGGQVCELCLRRAIPWPGIVHGCYRGSRGATAVTAAMLATHRVLGTWRRKVDVYIALTEFARRKFVEGGLPAERIAVKPNFVSGNFTGKVEPGDYALFVGRLSHEKGPRLLPLAWASLREHVPLRIVGDGPLVEKLSSDVQSFTGSQIELTGRLSSSDVRSFMLGARFLVFPSVWFETFGLVIVEAFAAGTPVIVSRLGSMAEIVQDGVTGLHFEPGNAADLAAKVEWAWNHPEEMARMGRAGRAEYEAKYTPAKNYEMLMEIYRKAMERKLVRAESQAVHVRAPGD
jgi:glycosyltransferase involved in cell wall biosynthesis